MTQLVVALPWHHAHVAGLEIRPSLISRRTAVADQPSHGAPASRQATTSQGRTHFSHRLEKAAVEVDFFFILPFPLGFFEFMSLSCTFRASACLWCTAHEHGRRACVIVEYLETSAKAFARDSRGKDVHLGSHLGSLEQGSGSRDPSVIDRNDFAQ